MKGNYIPTITKTPNDFVLSFKLKPHATFIDWSIIRFTTTTNNYCNHGDRWLVVWLFPNSFKISFVAGSESSVTNYLDTDGVVANTWNDMKVVTIGDLIRLHINDAVK